MQKLKKETILRFQLKTFLCDIDSQPQVFIHFETFPSTRWRPVCHFTLLLSSDLSKEAHDHALPWFSATLEWEEENAENQMHNKV
jgi:hypothetical protein